ncbi:MAG: carbohydrate kinase family protein [Reichenbachiella sp.]
MEVICSGLNVVDLLVSVPQIVPKGKKTACDQIIIQGGAPAGNAACALASLGHSTGFLGYFGDNTLSDIAKYELEKHHVHSDFFKEKKGATPAIAIVQIDEEGERTVLYSMSGYTPFSPTDINDKNVAQAKLILVDGYDTVINTHLLNLAKKFKVRSVLDLESNNAETMLQMVKLATDAILPLEAAQFLTKQLGPKDCLYELSKMTEAQLIITDGTQGSFAFKQGEILHQPAFRVEVVDTTGCGDSFHAAYASALLQGMDLKQRMEYASRYASEVAQHFGGRTFLPDRDYMSKFFPMNIDN